MKLLTQQDVRSVDAFTGARAQELGSFPIFENPDLRGPCGGHVSGLSFKGGFGRAFVTTQRELAQIDVPTSARLRHFLTAAAADVQSRCMPYDSQTDTGATQHVSDIHIVDLSALGVPTLAWTATISVIGHSVSGGQVTIDAGKTFVFLQFAGLSLTDESVTALARLALKRAIA